MLRIDRSDAFDAAPRGFVWMWLLLPPEPPPATYYVVCRTPTRMDKSMLTPRCVHVHNKTTLHARDV